MPTPNKAPAVFNSLGKQPFGPANNQTTQSIGIPAPVQGIVANNPMYTDVSVENAAIWLYNMIPRELGCSVRPGSHEYATNIPDKTDTPGEIRTIMYYNAIIAGGSVDFMFVTTDKGVFDVTAGGAGPWVPVLEWPVQSDDAGWCSYVNYTNVAGDHFLLVCDEANGYYIFDGASWAPGNITGSKPEPENLVHIVEWSGRLWFTERNTARAWYLDVLDLAGNLEAFDVGSRFIKGGHLVQCATWTVDDGAGLNDRLVMVSAAGDVLVWDGDPDIIGDPLTLLGRWYVGTLVEGRRAISNWAGDSAILSSEGVSVLSELMQERADKLIDNHITKNISRYFRQQMAIKRDYYGWQIELNSGESTVIITVPAGAEGEPPLQFVLNVNTGTWCFYRDLDMLCISDTALGFFFGTHDGRLMQHTGEADDVSLDGSTAKTIAFSLMTHYNSLGSPTTWKRPQFIRPSWVGAAEPVYNIQIKYDFDLTELSVTPPYVNVDLALWDAAIWDANVWAGTAQSYLETRGCIGMGRHLAVAVRGETSFELSLLGFDLMGDGGGLL